MNKAQKFKSGGFINNDFYVFNPFMLNVYKLIQEHGYAMTDVPLNECSQEMKELVFSFCIKVMDRG